MSARDREPFPGLPPTAPARTPPPPVRLPSSLHHLVTLQRSDGAWEGEMVWNTMILAQVIIVRRIVGDPIDEATRDGMIRHFEVSRREDGSWGMHPESGGYVFCTTLAYVALRLLGLPPAHPLVAGARRWLRQQPGGVLSIPSWGKYWLAFLDLYGYQGVNPCPPEIYLLPPSLPIHPGRYYCHTRNIYLALAYLYGSRFRVALDPALRDALRGELYGVPYDSIDFAAHRHDVAKTDLYVPIGPLLRRALDGLAFYERHPVSRLRERALDRCFERIVDEQRVTAYQALSPVNGLLDCLALHARDPRHPDLAPSLAGVEAWRWQDAGEGVRYAGARSQTWDTAFALHALSAASPMSQSAPLREAARRGYAYLLGAQLVDELDGGTAHHRDPIRGGWCFSDGAHRWPVSDCTAEAVSALLAVERRPGLTPPASARISDERLTWARDFILLRQNPDGGFGSYERRRGSMLLERINNTEMYGNCMTERSYAECTASSVAALADLARARPQLDLPRLRRAIERGVRFLRGWQRSDGSIPGFWGIHFTYGAFHVVRALRAAGIPPSDPTLRRAAAWLVAHQRKDGGWGEHFTSCLDDRYLEHPQSQVVMTAWALLALLEIIGPHAPSVERGLAWLRRAEHADGSFPSQSVNGVFFGSAMLDYRLYKAYFPAWALARAEAVSSVDRNEGRLGDGD